MVTQYDLFISDSITYAYIPCPYSICITANLSMTLLEKINYSNMFNHFKRNW